MNILVLNRHKNFDIETDGGKIFVRTLDRAILSAKAYTIKKVVLYDLKWKNVSRIVKLSILPMMPVEGEIIEYDFLQRFGSKH